MTAMLAIAGVLWTSAALGTDGGSRSREWSAQWIGSPDCVMQDWRGRDLPAPVFRKVFTLSREKDGCLLFTCGLGYFHVRLDGREVADVELCPAPTQYDRRWRYRRFPLTTLAKGDHELLIEVGDGLYRSTTPDSWHFDKATWLDYPKLVCELVDGEGRVIVKTDRSWQVCHGPTVHTAFRGGEIYDARRESAFDWKAPRIVPGPGGAGEEETMTPCRVVAVRKMTCGPTSRVYDAGVNLAGVPRLTVRGKRGSKVTLRCGERLGKDGRTIDGRLSSHVFRSPDFQTDVYVLKGEGVETWRPRFTYHGFRYVCAEVEGEAEILTLEALEINSDFNRIGSIKTSDPILVALERKALQAVRSNFVGNPTDCPHREKNGWLSEARLQAEALLYAYDAGASLLAFVDVACDTQRPSGQLAGMAPTSGWGYCWGSGPSYESGPFLLAESVWRFTGDDGGLSRHFADLKRNLRHFESLCDERGLVNFGLGDWMAPELDQKRQQRVWHPEGGWGYPEATNCPPTYIQTAFFKRELDLAAAIAGRQGSQDEAARFRKRAAEVARSAWNAFGSTDSSTGCALALEFGLCPEEEQAAVTEKLYAIVKRNGYRVDFGTIGSGCVLRALFENGFADAAYRMMTQREYPGYGYLAERADLTTFPECWNAEDESLNHGAFADVVACLYRYLAGLRHVARRPGRSFLEIRPMMPKGLQDFAAEHEGFRVAWKRMGRSVAVSVAVPSGAAAEYVSGRGDRTLLGPGDYAFVEEEGADGR